MRPRGGSESTATTQHDPALNSWCALVGIGETEKPVMIFLWTLLIQLVDWTVIDAKWCATMATPAHPETRRFTRGLGKPGTAAELRQSVSEVVRTSVLVVSTHLKPPPLPPFLFLLNTTSASVTMSVWTFVDLLLRSFSAKRQLTCASTRLISFELHGWKNYRSYYECVTLTHKRGKESGWEWFGVREWINEDVSVTHEIEKVDFCM